ncbi:MAG: outer membrane beta-barrel protein [Muribaculaceae bacterium]|nr:outer membrane beta-barrel protein [Muribaculaceae bacterium]
MKPISYQTIKYHTGWRALILLLAATASLTIAAQTTTEQPDSLDDLEMSVELKDLEVSAQRQLIKTEVDRVTYDVQADAESKTRTVMDMLRKVPLVTVDGEDNIRVKGNTSFRIYRNGHPDPGISQNPKQVLKAIPASMIKRIEVITEPGAKYDAEGVTAILNIVMKDASGMNGATGTVSAGIDSYGSPNANTYITAQHGKLVTSLNYGFMHNGRESAKQRQDVVQVYGATGDTLHTSGDGDASVNVHYGNIDASYEADSLNLLTASVGGYYYNYCGDGDALTTMTAADGSPIYRFGMHTHATGNHYYNVNGRLDYQHRTHRNGEAITASYMLSSTLNKTGTDMSYINGWQSPMAYDGTRQRGNERFWEHTWQLDWTRPLTAEHKIETGLKYIYRSNRSHTTMEYSGTGVAVPDVDSRFKHLTQVGAAYASYTYTHGQWTARAGLRYEWSRLRASYPDGSQPAFHRNLSDWVPSASVNYQFDFARSLKFAFSTSINRPGISYLNPAVIENPTSIHYGNAHLSSARNYSTSITYMQIGPRFTFNVAPNFSWSNNEITAVRWREGGMDIDTYQNTLTRRHVGVNAFFQWQVAAKTSMMFNGDLGHDYYRSDALDLTNKGHWASFFYTNVTQQLPWKLRLSGFAGKWGGGADGLYGYNGDGWFYGLSLQRSFLKEDRLTINLSAQKPFSPRYSGFTNHTTQGDYTGQSHFEFSQRRFNLSISYRFGSLKTRVKKTDKTIENDDVVGGSSAGGSQGQNNGQGGQGMK